MACEAWPERVLPGGGKCTANSKQVIKYRNVPENFAGGTMPSSVYHVLGDTVDLKWLTVVDIIYMSHGRCQAGCEADQEKSYWCLLCLWRE